MCSKAILAVVTVGPEDYESDDVLAGMRFQQKWEKKAYEAAAEKKLV